MAKKPMTAKQRAAVKRWQQAGVLARSKKMTAMKKGLARMLTRSNSGKYSAAMRKKYKKASKRMVENIKMYSK